MKVGDYVRTKKGIEKITYIRESVTLGGYEKYMTSDKRAYENLTDFANIIKSSPNIIDLIEEGDFIDGKQVVKAIHCSDGFNRIELFGGKAIMNNTPIKSIVTKEQFESIEYKIESEVK